MALTALWAISSVDVRNKAITLAQLLLCAALLFPNLIQEYGTADYAIPVMIVKILPVGLTGLTLAGMLENKLFYRFQVTNDPNDLIKLKAVQDALTAKSQNVNSGLIFDRLAYTLAKGGKTWHR